MLVGRPYEEATLYRVTHAFVQSGDWRSRQAPERRETRHARD